MNFQKKLCTWAKLTPVRDFHSCYAHGIFLSYLTLLQIHLLIIIQTPDMSEQSELTSARYGKTKVRVFRVVREDKWHHVVEYNVEVLLEGDIAAR